MLSTSSELTNEEQKGLNLLKEKKQIYQSEFWKQLDISSRKGSRIIAKLLDKDLIQTEETVYNGHNTYLITIKTKPEELDFSLLMADDMISPFIGDENVDCMSDEFTEWLLLLTE